MTEGSPPPICQVSHVTCHMSCVTCHIDSGEASQWRVCYQRGLPCLVLIAKRRKKFELVGGGSVFNGTMPSSFYKTPYPPCVPLPQLLLHLSPFSPVFCSQSQGLFLLPEKRGQNQELLSLSPQRKLSEYF